MSFNFSTCQWNECVQWNEGDHYSFNRGGRTSKLLSHIWSHLNLALLSQGTWYHPWWCDCSYCVHDGLSESCMFTQRIRNLNFYLKKPHKPLPWRCRIEEDDFGEGIYWAASLKNCRFWLPLLQMCCGILPPCGSGLQIILPWSVCKYELGLACGFAFATG